MWPQAEMSGWIWPKFKLIHAFMHALDTCKNEENKIECLLYIYMGIFSDAQGQITPQDVIGSGQISNSSDTWYGCPAYLQE